MTTVIVSEEANASPTEIPVTQTEVLQAEAIEAIVEGSVTSDNDVAIAAIEADAEVAIAETNAAARVAEAEAYNQRTGDQWEAINRLTQMVETLTEKVETLTKVETLENSEPSPISLETLEEVAETLNETSTETNLMPISTQEETSETLTEVGVKSVGVEVPGIVVNEKPVRVPIVKLV